MAVAKPAISARSFWSDGCSRRPSDPSRDAIPGCSATRIPLATVEPHGQNSIRIGKDQWNHNIHYGLEVLDLVPDGASDALDVGCGDGWMVRELSQRVTHVVGLDPDEVSLSLAGRLAKGKGVEYVRGGLLTQYFEPCSFDFITCIAALHHMDEQAGMGRIAELVRPGGTVAIVGLARSRVPIDLPWEIAGALATRAHRITRRYWETPAPKVWPPPHSYREMRELSASVLPGSMFRRRALWRYVVTWTKPLPS
jgi:SAM-dependent methyltransferase